MDFTATYHIRKAFNCQEKLRMFSLCNDHDTPSFWLDEHISIMSFQRTNQGWGLCVFSEGSSTMRVRILSKI